MNNPYFLSALSGFVVYITQLLIKKSKGEKTDKMDMIKIALIVSIGVFCLLSFYERENPPTLNEPFISSLEA